MTAARDRSPQTAEKVTQETQPKKGQPIDIPVPKRREVDDLIRKAAKSGKED